MKQRFKDRRPTVFLNTQLVEHDAQCIYLPKKNLHLEGVGRPCACKHGPPHSSLVHPIKHWRPLRELLV